MNFKLRVDGSWSDISGVITSKIAPFCEKAVFYEHPPEPKKGVHVHALLWGWSKSEDSCRNPIKALRPSDAVKWSYQLCEKQCKKGPPVDEGYIAYMTKGKHDPCLLKGWSSEYILEQRAKGYDKKDLIVASKVQSDAPVAYVKSKKPTSEEKMNAWLVHECGWKLGSQFTLAHLEKECVRRQEPLRNNRALQLVCGGIIRPQVIAYANGRVHNQQLIAMVRNALWNFADDDVRDVMKECMCSEIMFA